MIEAGGICPLRSSTTYRDPDVSQDSNPEFSQINFLYKASARSLPRCLGAPPATVLRTRYSPPTPMRVQLGHRKLVLHPL